MKAHKEIRMNVAKSRRLNVVSGAIALSKYNVGNLEKYRLGVYNSHDEYKAYRIS
jgi:hypothetical protein